MRATQRIIIVVGDTSRLRTFFNADRSKSFKAVLLGYDPASKMVNVRKSNGRTMRFNLEHLSEEDQAHVLKKFPTK